MKELTRIIDGETVSDEIVNKFNLRQFCTLNDSGSFVSRFVGLVMTRDEILFSCPKHLGYKDENDIELVLGCMMKSSKQIGYSSENPVESNIPYDAYLFILDYYQRYGLHVVEKKEYKRGYDGSVNWLKTSRESQKIVSGGNIVFLPLIINNNHRQETFIAECMKYVLKDGYEKFGKYVGVGTVVDNTVSIINSDNLNQVINRLKQERNNYFKDLEIQLIDALLEYFLWRGVFTGNSFFVSKSFETIWENMVNTYLCANYLDYDYVDNRICFKKECRQSYFCKKKEYIQSELKRKENSIDYWVEYDHYNKNGDVVIVFDSKYYVEIKEINYKQIAYHYFLKNSELQNKSPETIINGLIIPYEGEYYSKVHVDRTDIDGLLIIEHYVNLRDVLTTFVK